MATGVIPRNAPTHDQRISGNLTLGGPWPLAAAAHFFYIFPQYPPPFLFADISTSSEPGPTLQ